MNRYALYALLPLEYLSTLISSVSLLLLGKEIQQYRCQQYDAQKIRHARRNAQQSASKYTFAKEGSYNERLKRVRPN